MAKWIGSGVTVMTSDKPSGDFLSGNDLLAIKSVPIIPSGDITAKTKTVRYNSTVDDRVHPLRLDKIQAEYTMLVEDLMRNGSEAATLEVQTKLAGMIAWHLLESKALKVNHIRNGASNTVTITAELGIFSS